MSATVKIFEMTGASAGTDKTSGTVRFKSADEQSVDTSNRLQIPTSDWFYSYTKQLRLRITQSPSVDISNIKCYPDAASSWASVEVYTDKQSAWAANACANIRATGATDLWNYSSASPCTLAATTATFKNTGYIGKFLRLQMRVHNSARPGSLATERLTFSYDET